ncbi:MAG: hypothetical protein MH252_04560 [Thermosynechococcaceae cyanobacterium MS004]|nr:hypothetical protein [Thermosynechococcaceae cyanobacterium MS004]
MNSFRQVLLKICLVFIFSIPVAVHFTSGESLAASLSMPIGNLRQYEIAALNQEEGIANNVKFNSENLIAAMAVISKDKSAKKVDKFEADTQKAIINSIENPNYQPNRSSKEAERQNRDSNEDMEAQVHENFKKVSE